MSIAVVSEQHIRGAKANVHFEKSMIAELVEPKYLDVVERTDRLLARVDTAVAKGRNLLKQIGNERVHVDLAA